MITYVWIALGGALGSMARYGCSSLAARWIGETLTDGMLDRKPGTADSVLRRRR